MTTARDLISNRVVVGRGSDRLADVAGHMARIGTHHLVVIHETTGKFVGIVRLSDVAWRANAGTRILADLVSSVRPVTVHPNESAEGVSELFQLHRLGEAAVVSEDDTYIGLITSESVLEWYCSELRRTQNLLRLETEVAEAVKARLEAAGQEKEKYLSALAHTLRSPLNPMLLIASSRAGDGQLPDDLRRDFQIIANNAAAEAKMIDDLIDAARPSRQKAMNR